MKRKRDYQRKDFKNPYFGKRKKKTKAKFWLIFSFLFIFIFSLSFLNNLSQLQIKNIQISGNQQVTAKEIEQVVTDQLNKKRWFFFSQSNILFFSKGAAKKELAKKYFFTSLEIKKKYFDTIAVSVQEEISSLIWISGNDYFYLDATGKATRKIESQDLVVKEGVGDTQLIRSALSGNNYPLVYDLSNNPVIIGQPAVNKDLVDFVLAIDQEINQGADFEISHYNLTNPSIKEIVLVTQEGWEIRFKTDESAKKQLDLLFSVLQQQVKDRSKLEYVDLRFGDKVFWK